MSEVIIAGLSALATMLLFLIVFTLGGIFLAVGHLLVRLRNWIYRRHLEGRGPTGGPHNP